MGIIIKDFLQRQRVLLETISILDSVIKFIEGQKRNSGDSALDTHQPKLFSMVELYWEMAS